MKTLHQADDFIYQTYGADHSDLNDLVEPSLVDMEPAEYLPVISMA